jgi:hypothetical protein
MKLHQLFESSESLEFDEKYTREDNPEIYDPLDHLNVTKYFIYGSQISINDDTIRSSLEDLPRLIYVNALSMDRVIITRG